MLGVIRPLRNLFALFEDALIARVVLLLNVIGFVAGTVYWYGPTFLYGKDGLGATSPLFWVFIPDCPLFAALFVIAFLGLQRGKRWTWFYTITAIGLIKYGVWTVVFWASYWIVGAPVTVEGVIMFVTHVGMILEGIYLLTRFHTQLRYALLALAWFALSDVVDYGFGQYPYFYPSVPLALMQWHTIFMTLALSLWVGWLALRGNTEQARSPALKPKPHAGR